MYRVIIAEDEPAVRAGVKGAIPWAQYEMTVVADVSNGQEAWEAYLKYKPELIITDIKMPIMNGMDFIERIRKQDRSTRIVILSCLDEFDRVRKAFTLGVSDYISKLTMTSDEMQHVISKVYHEMSVSAFEMKIPGNAMERLQLKESLLKDFLFRERFSEREFISLATELQWRVRAVQPMQMCLIEIEDYERLQKRFKDDYGLLTKMSLLNVMDEIVGQAVQGEVVYDQRNRFILLYNVPAQGVQSVLQEIREAFAVYFDASLTAGISGVYPEFSRIHVMYRESKEALKHMFVEERSKTLCYASDIGESYRAKVLETFGEMMDTWQLPDRSLQQRLCDKVQEFLLHAELNKDKIIDLFLYLTQVSIVEFNLQGEHVWQHYQQFYAKCLETRSLRQLCGEFSDCLRQLPSLMDVRPTWSEEVEVAIQYLEIRYQEEISLQKLASHVNLSANYLCTLFKKETGFSPIDYLIQYRIGKAKQWLIETNFRTYEIADQVGFADYSYFSRMFKKITGINPSQFRKMQRNDGTWSDKDHEDQT